MGEKESLIRRIRDSKKIGSNEDVLPTTQMSREHGQFK